MTEPALAKEHVLFCAAGVSLCVPTEHVHAVHTSLSIDAVANTCDWFLGIAVADGNLIPVSDLGAYLFQRKAHGDVIQVATQLGGAGLRVDQVLGVSSNDVQTTDDVKQAHMTSHYVRQKEVDYRILDVASMLTSERFMNINCEPA